MVFKNQSPLDETEPAHRLEPTISHGDMWKEVSALMMDNHLVQPVQKLLSRQNAVAIASLGMTRGFDPVRDDVY